MIKEIALLTPVYVSLFWAFIFFIQKGKINRPKRTLGIFMTLAFLLYSSHAIFFNKWYTLYSYFESVYEFSMLSVYPMYFTYLVLLTQKEIRYKYHFIHFIPAIFFGLSAIITTLILSPDERILYVSDTLINKNLKQINFDTAIGIKGFFFLLSRMLFVVQVIYYLIRGILVANKYNERLAGYYSNLEGRTLNWVRILNIAFLIISFSSISLAFIGRSIFLRNDFVLLLPSAVFSTFLFVIGLKGNTQVAVNFEFTENEKTQPVEMKNGQIKSLKQQLLNLFEIDKIYMVSDLKITSVAELLKTNRTYVSNLINQEFQMNFNEFVNKFRLNEAKKLLGNKENSFYTMEHIAEKSGFGSVNSFSRVFRESEGVTPGRYKEKFSGE